MILAHITSKYWHLYVQYLNIGNSYSYLDFKPIYLTDN